MTGNASSATTATTATNANNIAITDNTSSVSTYYPVISSATTGNVNPTTSSTKLSFVPNTGVFSATSFSGAGTGLTGTASSLSIGGNATTSTSSTNISGGSANQIPYQTNTGATSFITAPTIALTYLQWNGTGFTWASASAGLGTVTSVSVVSANGFSGSVATPTTTPAITLSTTITGVIYGNGTSISAASGSQIVTAIGTTAVTNATNAANVATADTTTNANYYPVFVNATGSNVALNTGSSKLKYNPSTGALYVSAIYIAP